MDEPDSALDFLNRHMVLSKISELIKEESKAGLITLHDPNFAMAYCDRLFMLKQGNIVGELDMRAANRDEVQQKLSLIYGNIDIVETTAASSWVGPNKCKEKQTHERNRYSKRTGCGI